MFVNLRLWLRSFVVVATFSTVPLLAQAQGADGGLTVTPFGAVEAVYAYNFREPSNGINVFRLNDGRHATFAVSNLVIGVEAVWRIFSARLAFQIGEMPDLYYSAADAPRWRNVQEARAGVTVGRFGIDCGIYLSPAGPEAMTTNGSNNTLPGAETPNASNAAIGRPFDFYGLPFYHVGCRGSVSLGRGFTLYAWFVNGWNNVVDNNSTPTGALNLQYISRRLSWSVLAMAGNERSTGASEGRPIRWLFDLSGQWHSWDWLAFIGQVNGGFEDNRFGRSGWFAASLAARVHFHRHFYVAARGGFFREWIGTNVEGSAAPIFWPAGTDWLASGTFTLAWRPHDNTLVRLEYRHDAAGANAFYAGQVAGDGSFMAPFVPNAQQQDTVTAGLTAWF